MALTFITVGFALLQSNLNINGTIATRSNTWDIYFDNVILNQDSVSDTLPVITEKTSLSFDVELLEMGDFYEFTVDVVNDGTIDAMVNAITATNLTENQAKLIDLSYTYEDGTPIAVKDYLKASTRDTIKVYVKYKDDVSPDDLANSGEDLPISIEIEYVQADDTVNYMSKNYRLSTLSNPNGSVSDGMTIKYGETKNITVTPDTGYYISSFKCDSGYTVRGGATGEDAITAKVFTVDNSNSTCDSTCTASFSARSFNVETKANANGTIDSSTTIKYAGTKSITVTPNSGYYVSSFTCDNGYTVSGGTTGTSATSAQTFTVSNNNNASDTTCTASFSGRSYNITTKANANGTVGASTTVTYGGTKNITVTPDTGYYISSFTCDNGYTVSGGATGTSATSANTFTVSNNSKASASTCTASFAARSFNVAISRGTGILSISVSDLSVPYKGSKTFTYTLVPGYEYSGVTCTNSYTASRSGTTITVTNPGNTSTSTCLIGARMSNYAATKVLSVATPSEVKCGHWSPTRGAAADSNHGCSWKWFRCDGCGLEQQHYTCTAENGSGWGAGSHYNTVYSCSVGTLEGTYCATYTCPNGGTLSGTTCIVQ